jgi:acetyl-CoA C-acetyltransferase
VFNHLSTVTGQPGSVTAGNAPGVNDGGDVCLLMSREKADELGLKPIFTIVDYAEVSQPTKDIATVPGLAIKKILEQNDMTLDQMDVIEINEAFAAQVLADIKELAAQGHQVDPDKVNPNGGAIAFGHPNGMSGTRIAIFAMNELKRRGGKYAICSLCIGGGQGLATIFERLS